MDRFTANYAYTDSNFEIYNIPNTKKKDRYYALYCVLMNLFQRGCPTKPSVFLSDKIDIDQSQTRKVNFFSKDNPQWGNTIKGDYERDLFPARKFYDELIPQMFPEYPFLRQIMIPEAKIMDFIHDGNKSFINQAVDFLIEPLKLVIEIDGSQHEADSQSALDSKRDEYIQNHGYKVVRIPSRELEAKLTMYQKMLNDIFKQHESDMDAMADDYAKCVEDRLPKSLLKAVSTIRFQVLLLQLCLKGVLSLEDSEWKIAVNNHEVTGYEDNALKDVLLWLKNLCVLSGIEYKEPNINIIQTSQLGSTDANTVKVDFSLFEKTTPFSSMYPDRIYVRNCWIQSEDYFILRTTKPIAYHIEDFVNERQLENAEFNPRRVALRFMLKNLYGFDSFRPGQERIVMNALRGRSTIGVLPTGSGKSLCYQLAVLLQPCVSFCVCPIKSLMIDQDFNLKERGIQHTAYLSSDLTGEEKGIVESKFAEGKYLCVFMSPERFQSEEFRNYLRNMSESGRITFGYAVLDEVHCLSEWGHSFRVSYLNLVKTIRRYCEGAVLLGLTATASFNVLKNILVEFEMNDRRDVVSIPSFTRDELTFRVINSAKDRSKKRIKGVFPPDIPLIETINRYLSYYPDLLNPIGDKTRCGIIFTAYVNGLYGCYELSNRLVNGYNKDIRFYSGETPKKYDSINLGPWDKYKRSVQDDFKNNLFALLCATKAFGMGIDKPNIRYTIHYGIPGSLESLYQEAGRAGRDRKAAECTVIYTPEIPQMGERIENLLSVKTKPSDISAFVNDKENSKNGEDVFRQLRLLASQATDVEFELDRVKKLLDKFGKPDTVANIRERRPEENDWIDYLQLIQKEIYHLSLIGVVRDWTVDWKLYSVRVYFSDYTSDSVYETTEKYIRNYDPDFEIIKHSDYKPEMRENAQDSILNSLTIFLNWYAENILYSRRQALLNVKDACEKYEVDGPEMFKERMEAYFRLDDVSDILGTIADQPREVEAWFEVLNPERLKKDKIEGIVMNLNRFLESFQANVGLNYISGFLHLINHHFDEPNGKERLYSALEVIKEFKDEDKEYVLAESARLVCELGDLAVIDEFAEFFIRNYDFDDTERVIYKVTESDYALQTFLRRMMLYMTKLVGGKKNG